MVARAIKGLNKARKAGELSRKKLKAEGDALHAKKSLTKAERERLRFVDTRVVMLNAAAPLSTGAIGATYVGYKAIKKGKREWDKRHTPEKKKERARLQKITRDGGALSPRQEKRLRELRGDQQ